MQYIMVRSWFIGGLRCFLSTSWALSCLFRSDLGNSKGEPHKMAIQTGKWRWPEVFGVEISFTLEWGYLKGSATNKMWFCLNMGYTVWLQIVCSPGEERPFRPAIETVWCQESWSFIAEAPNRFVFGKLFGHWGSHGVGRTDCSSLQFLGDPQWCHSPDLGGGGVPDGLDHLQLLRPKVQALRRWEQAAQVVGCLKRNLKAAGF